MEDVTTLVKTTLGEIERMLSTKAVVGEPATIDGKTFVPLIAVGFAFGAGGGQGRGKGEGKRKAEGEGEAEGGLLGTAGGGGVRPLAIIVIDEKGVRVEGVRGGLTSVMDRLVEEIPEIVDKCGLKKDKDRK